MRHVFPVIAVLLIVLSGCDTQPPKPKAPSAQALATLNDKSPSSTSFNPRENVDVLQRQAYVSLVRGELLSACRQAVQQHVFETAVCRQQRQAGIEWLSDVQGALPKPSAVLGKREDKRNPWHWLVARETCWSADCLQAERLRSFAKRCGALQGSCLHGEIVW